MASSLPTVVHLENRQNCIECGGERYIVLRDSKGAAHTIAGKCRHRGGPLHLGALDASCRSIICPWHKSKTSLIAAVASELPTVRCGERISVILQSGTQSKVHALRRTFLLDCESALTGIGSGNGQRPQ